jgi:hypothetical protein
VLSLFEDEEGAELRAMSAVLCDFGGEGEAMILGLISSAKPVTLHGGRLLRGVPPHRVGPVPRRPALRPNSGG